LSDWLQPDLVMVLALLCVGLAVMALLSALAEQRRPTAGIVFPIIHGKKQEARRTCVR